MGITNRFREYSFTGQANTLNSEIIEKGILKILRD
jgi:hypothetical protein